MHIHRRQHVLVGLDLSEMDQALIRYTGLLEQWLPPAHITFLHNVKLGQLPPELKTPGRLAEIMRTVEQKLQQLVTAIHRPACPYTVMVTVDEFSELAFTREVKEKEAGLVILGNKQYLEGSGGLNQKLLRMLPAAVLLVPETFRGRPLQVVQAIDFSKYTPVVLQWGRAMEAFPPAEGALRFHPVYVSKLSYHFFPLLSEGEIEDSLKKDEAARRKKWAAHFPGYPPLQIIAVQEKSIASSLLEYAGSISADMIIMGVKGATSLTNLFMGSVANEMVQRETGVCLLMVGSA